MSIRSILIYPDPRLRLESRKVDVITDKTRRLVGDMIDTMYAANGAGLAAIQIGALERIFILDAYVAGGREDDPPVVFINPTVSVLGHEQATDDEGCLSFPDIFVPIKRHKRVRVKATSLAGKIFEMDAEGLYARAAQHETDHTHGKLMIDHVGETRREMIKRMMKRHQPR